jgi:hypothetical protein
LVRNRHACILSRCSFGDLEATHVRKSAHWIYTFWWPKSDGGAFCRTTCASLSKVSVLGILDHFVQVIHISLWWRFNCNHSPEKNEKR